MIFKDYYEYQLHLNRFGVISRGDRARIISVVNFMKQFMTKEQLAVMMDMSSDFDMSTKKKNISEEISQLAMAELLRLEKIKQPIEPNASSGRKKPTPKDSVPAFEKRLSNLKKKK
jgi:hypothetical protein